MQKEVETGSGGSKKPQTTLADDDDPDATDNAAAKEFTNGLAAKTQLDHINEKLQNKIQALKALQGSLKSDSKVIKMLQGQVESLQEHKSQVEQHMERTEAWAEHLGHWRCHVQNVMEDEDNVLKATLIVHVVEHKSLAKPSWICLRTVQDFHNLNRQTENFTIRSVFF